MDDRTTLPLPVHPVSPYTRVGLLAWDCHLAVGDAAAAWAAVSAGHRVLRHDDGIWGAPLPGDPAHWLWEATRRAVARPWAALTHLPGPLAWSVNASKGDPGGLATPGRLTASVPGALGQRLALHLGAGMTRPAPVVAACSTGLYALLEVADLLERGYCQAGLAGAADGALPPWLRAGFENLGVLAGAAPPDSTVAGGARSTGFAPVPGAGFIALAHDGPWRLTAGVRLGDAGHETHFSDPRTLAVALASLWSCGPPPDLILVHGTGTPVGDRYEKAGLDDGPWSAIPRMACKPCWGHTLGASGAVELAAGLEAPVRRVWKISLGFGGHLAAVAIERT